MTRLRAKCSKGSGVEQQYDYRYLIIKKYAEDGKIIANLLL